MSWRVDHGDCRDVMAALPAMSVDAIVCDPPYGLGFMGKDWDSPGGTGDFPMRRSTEANTVNTGATRQGGRQRSCEDFSRRQARDARNYQAWCETWAIEALRVLKPGGHLLAFGGTRTYHRLACAIEDAGFEVRDTIAWMYGSGFPKSLNVGKALPDWQGWGTALKPAHEPIVVARKSPIGTVAANVLAHGTGALNVDTCRIAHSEECRTLPDQHGSLPGNFYRQGGRHGATLELKPAGRWPANVVLDPEAGAVLDEQTGVLTSGSGPLIRNADKFGRNTYGNFKGTDEVLRPGSSGGASRFFYCAKAGRGERCAGLSAFNTHPTVKPIALMRWLVRLVTPPDGLVLDPFAGSGTTGIACVLEGFGFHGIEREAEYVAIAHARIAHWAPVEPPQLSMEGLDAA